MLKLIATLVAVVVFAAVCGFAASAAYQGWAARSRGSTSVAPRYALPLWALLALVAGVHAALNLWLAISQTNSGKNTTTLVALNTASGLLVCVALVWIIRRMYKTVS